MRAARIVRRSLQQAEPARRGVDVLVAASGEVDEEESVGAELPAHLHGAGQCVAGLQRRDDALGLTQQTEGLHRLLVGDGPVLRAAALEQVRVLRPDTRVVQAGRDRVRLHGLAVVVLHDVGERAVEDAGKAGCKPRRVAAGVDALAAGLQTDEANAGVVEEPVEDPHGVGPAADAGENGVRKSTDEVEHLGSRLDSNDPVEVADHLGEGVRAGHRAEDVVGGVHGGNPVAERLVDGVLEGLTAVGDGHDVGAEQPHAGDVEGLSLRVDLAHVDGAVEAEQRSGGGRGNTVLTGAGLGDDAGLAHPPGQQRLAEHVVDLVGTGVVEVLTLEDHPSAPGVLRKSWDLGDDARPTGVGAVQPL